MAEAYIDSMLKHEHLVTIYMGMAISIPHSTTAQKARVKRSGIVIPQYPDGVDFGDEKAQLVFGIVDVGDEHIDLLSSICTALEDKNVLRQLKSISDVSFVLKCLEFQD